MATDTDTLLSRISNAVDALQDAQETVVNFASERGGPVFAEGNQTLKGTKTFESSPVVPNPSSGDNSNKVATTSFVQSAVANSEGKSTITTVKTFTVSPVVPDVTTTDSSTKAANTNFVHSVVDAENAKNKSVSGTVTYTVSPIVPTQAAGDSTTKVASTKFVHDAIVADYAVNKSLTGTVTFTNSPVIPTPAAGDNSTNAATTAFVARAVAASDSGNKTFTGSVNFSVSPTAPTPASTDASDKLATTSFVKQLIATAELGLGEEISAAALTLSDAINSTSGATQGVAATPKAVKTAYDLANSKWSKVDASVNAQGIVKLSDAVNSTSTTLAATANAVKKAYDLANGKYTAANATTSAAGLMTAADKTKLDGIATGANNYAHPAYTARTGKPTANQTPAFGGTFTISQVTSDASGHVTGMTDRTITIPGTAASTSAKGIVQLSDAVNSTSTTLAATANAVKKAYDLANGKWAAVNGTTSAKGIVQLSDAVDSTSTTLAATANAVKKAYALANTANTTADSAKTLASAAMPKSGGKFTAGVFENVVAVAAAAIEVNKGGVFTKTISANTTFTIAGVPSGAAATFSLVLTNGGSKTVTWPSSVKWAYGVAPVLTSQGTDVLTFVTYNGGGTWYGVPSLISAA